ncbi:hypothetical protein O181_053797 [Austropuccinia psidii MF-1]|uniref:Uncharacterized protein n=1 Tax=Austropuccinia psidii MF-1 TaxID=1389203 RepID=A0A9Q3EAC8_9BASI|nr:hypothetical protein [Austropuccinia psidii MF-1]
MEHERQDIQPAFKLGKSWGKRPEDMSQRDIFKRPYGNYQRLEPQQEVQTLRREGSQGKGESSYNLGYRRETEPEG